MEKKPMLTLWPSNSTIQEKCNGSCANDVFFYITTYTWVPVDKILIFPKNKQKTITISK